MSQRYSSVESIMQMLEGDYSNEDIKQALADLEAMWDNNNISEYKYKNVKKLLEDKL